MTVTQQHKGLIKTYWVDLKGGWAGATKVSAVSAGTYEMKLTANGTDTFVTVTLKDARTQAKIVLKEGVSVTYTKDAAAMRTQILDKLVDWSQTTVSKEAAAKSMVIEYKTKGYLSNTSTNKLSPELWFPIEGGSVTIYTAPSIGAGENQKIRASFPTTADYHGCDAAEGTLTVDKANVRVKVQGGRHLRRRDPDHAAVCDHEPGGHLRHLQGLQRRDERPVRHRLRAAPGEYGIRDRAESA